MGLLVLLSIRAGLPPDDSHALDGKPLMFIYSNLMYVQAEKCFRTVLNHYFGASAILAQDLKFPNREDPQCISNLFVV